MLALEKLFYDICQIIEVSFRNLSEASGKLSVIIKFGANFGFIYIKIFQTANRRYYEV